MRNEVGENFNIVNQYNKSTTNQSKFAPRGMPCPFSRVRIDAISPFKAATR